MTLSQYIISMSATQLIFGPAFIIMGFLAIYIHVAKSRSIKASLSWPAVDGIIMHSYYYHAPSSKGTPSGPDIRYYFILHGKKYESSRVSIIDEHPSHVLLERFKKGGKAKVYYNPDNPKKSVLIPGGNFNFYVNLFLIILPLFGVGIGVFIFG